MIKSSEISGVVVAPPSKSMTHRALILAALAEGESIIRNPLTANDTEATSRVLARLGVKQERHTIWRVKGGTYKAPLNDLDCSESGTTLRFMTAICPLVKGDSRLVGGYSLSHRPVGPLLDALRQIGAFADSRDGYPPVTIHGFGRISGGAARLPGDVSSQFVSALLAVAPLAENPISIKLLTPLESRPYVSMTLDAMRLFGVEAKAKDDMRMFNVPIQPYRSTQITVEGDWSSAAYMLAAGILAGGVRVEGLKPESSQADREITRILDAMGADISVGNDHAITRRSHINRINVNLSDCPDLFPVVASLCAIAEGESLLTGLARLRLKESDRVEAMAEGLGRMGCRVTREGNAVSIRGNRLRGAEIDPKGDHRIAMAHAVLALAAEGETTIGDAECVSKSYPGFWDDLEGIGARIKRIMR